MARNSGSKRTVLLTVAYDGQPYSGFVVQQNAKTVGGVLLRAMAVFDPTVVKLNVASRTDAGVHARAQRVAFDTVCTMPMRAWVLGLAKRLPDSSIVVREAVLAPVGFNPRFFTTKKHYRYTLLCERIDDPMLAGRTWRVGRFESADPVARLQAELSLAQGEHDFAGFASASDPREHTRRIMESLSAREIGQDPKRIEIDIVGDGFLHNMVRILVGTAVDVARGRQQPGAIARTLLSRSRRDAGVTAPAAGLMLEKIVLDPEPQGERWP